MNPLILFALAASAALRVEAASTIDASNRYAYGANLGWMDWVSDTNNGAVIGDYVCSGYVYSANVGWINLGNGAPTNGVRYQNISADDFGVNNDGLGNLRGDAWGANIGWITFEETGSPKVDLFTGQLSGSIWSANCGWISVSNAVANVQTDKISPGPMDTNGLSLSWEIDNFGQPGVDPNADADHDGMSNLQEYQAGTNPNDPMDYLRITTIGASSQAGNDNATLTWTSHPTRQYRIQQTTNLITATWIDAGILLSPDAGPDTTRSLQFLGPTPQRFFRIEAVKPLFP